MTSAELADFYRWVASRRAADTMTGDYVRDTRDALRIFAGNAEQVRQRERMGCYEAVCIGQRLRREWRKAGVPGRSLPASEVAA